jgi:hypothetical protein
MARRIAALLLMGPALDANYQTVKGAAAHFTSHLQNSANPLKSNKTT